jgi:uncharacterized protein YndB with AHSA1/START domain
VPCWLHRSVRAELLGLYDDAGALQHVGVTSSFTKAMREQSRSSRRTPGSTARVRLGCPKSAHRHQWIPAFAGMTVVWTCRFPAPSIVVESEGLPLLRILITMATNTVRLHRVLRAAPERVYRAFLDADAMAKWLPPYGFTCKVHQMDARVGGTFKMSFSNFSTGNGHSFGGKYRELVPHERIRYSDKFDDPNMPGEMETTVVLRAVSCGTELSITQEGIPEVIPAEMCYLGWQESLAQLATLVEPVIPD